MLPLETIYLICNKQDIDWGIYATTTGKTSYPPKCKYPFSYHPSAYYFNPQKGRILDDYMLVYITKGTGFLRTNHLTTIQIKEGDLFLIPPNEWHSYAPNKETGWDEYWIGFKGLFVENLQQKGFLSSQCTIWKVGSNIEIISLFEKIILTSQQQQPGYQQTLSGLIIQLLTLGLYWSQHFNRENHCLKLINKAKAIMIQNLENPLHPTAIAERLHVSYSWLRSNFKEYTNLSPAAYQQELKFERAKELLLHSELNIKEIAYQLNFVSPSNFAIRFKAKSGKTPNEFRKNHAINNIQ